MNSKAGFHGYCVWVRPKDDCNAQAVTQGIMQQFTRRFPPLLMPTWQPHNCLAAGAPSPSPPRTPPPFPIPPPPPPPSERGGGGFEAKGGGGGANYLAR